MKSKIKIFMENGGLVLLIATIAIGAYFIFLEFADNMFKNRIGEVNIVLNEDGTLNIPLEGDASNIYVYWECDGGTIKPSKEIEQETLKKQYRDDNKWHVAYSHSEDSVVWNSDDSEGDKYKSASIRATLYNVSDEEDVSYIASGNVQKVISITLEVKDGKIEKSEDRLYTNPVREDENQDWSEIYVIDNIIKGTYTLTYRTGIDIPKNEQLSMCWLADKKILKDTDLFTGGISGFKALKSDGEKILKQKNMVTCEIKEHTNIEAFIIDVSSESYITEEFEDSDKIGKAQITLEE